MREEAHNKVLSLPVSMDDGNTEDLPEFSVGLTDEAFYALATLPSERLFFHVDHVIGLLSTSPYLGREYDPVYDTTRPPFLCRVLFCEHYGIYYRVYEKEFRITIFAIVDQRRNPTERFDRFEYGITSFDDD